MKHSGVPKRRMILEICLKNVRKLKTSFKSDPQDLSQNVRNFSRRIFPRICESLKGVVPKNSFTMDYYSPGYVSDDRKEVVCMHEQKT